MKLVLAIVALLALGALSHHATEEEMQNSFIAFQHKHGKTYASKEEYSVRYAVFKSNLAIAHELNEKSETATFGITKFMDLTAEEFSTYFKGARDVTNRPDHHVAEVDTTVEIPASFDWRSKDALTPVYNQGQCGSCWAFSATETVESYFFLGGNTLTSLSMQQVVDCDTTCYGCNGGWTYEAYQYLEQAGGQDSYTSYPYTAETDSCSFKPSSVVAKVTGWSYVTQSEDETAMATFLAGNGPISVCVDASSWQTYTGGVITSSTCGTQIDHCVQISGYGSQSGQDVWNVRNSWGTDWGLSGYLYVARGTDTCGIAQVATSVVATTA